MSEFHLQGAFSYILTEHLLNEDNVFFIISKYHYASSQYRVTEGDCSLLKNEKFYFFYDKDDKTIDVISREHRCSNLIYIRPMLLPLMTVPKLFRLNNFRRVSYVLIDEGLGTYRNAEFWWKTEKIGNMFVFKIKQTMKYCIEIIEKLFFIKTITKHFLFFHDKEQGLLLNKLVVDSYKEYFEYFAKEKVYKTKSILFLSNYLSRLFIDKKDIIGVYKTFIDKIFEKYPDYKIYFKPHPIELEFFNRKTELNNVEIISEKISAENLLNRYEYDFIVGFDSTAILTSCLFFNTNAMTMINLLNLEEIKESYREHLTMFRNDIKNIKNIKEWE